MCFLIFTLVVSSFFAFSLSPCKRASVKIALYPLEMYRKSRLRPIDRALTYQAQTAGRLWDSPACSAGAKIDELAKPPTLWLLSNASMNNRIRPGPSANGVSIKIWNKFFLRANEEHFDCIVRYLFYSEKKFIVTLKNVSEYYRSLVRQKLRFYRREFLSVQTQSFSKQSLQITEEY